MRIYQRPMFELTPEQQERLKRWLEEQPASTGRLALNDPLTYIFHPTSLGTSVKVEHVSGSMIDLTDYHLW